MADDIRMLRLEKAQTDLTANRKMLERYAAIVKEKTQRRTRRNSVSLS